MNDQPVTAPVEALDKMSLKEMFGPLAAPMETRPLCVIIGCVENFKSKQTDAGQLVTFIGVFEAIEIPPVVKQQPDLPKIEPKPGRRFAARRCILPANSEKQLLARLADAKKANEIASVEFAMELTLSARNTALGYEISFKHLVAPRVQDLDPLATVRAEVQAALTAA